MNSKNETKQVFPALTPQAIPNLRKVALLGLGRRTLKSSREEESSGAAGLLWLHPPGPPLFCGLCVRACARRKACEQARSGDGARDRPRAPRCPQPLRRCTGLAGFRLGLPRLGGGRRGQLAQRLGRGPPCAPRCGRGHHFLLRSGQAHTREGGGAAAAPVPSDAPAAGLLLQ